MVIKVKDLVAHGRHDFVQQLSNHGGNDMRVRRQRRLNVSGPGSFVSLCSFHVDAMMDPPIRRIRLFFLLPLHRRLKDPLPSG